MKKYLILFLMAGFWSCSDHDNGNNNTILQAQTLLNVSYGSDAKQRMDIYLPERQNDQSTKVLFLVHGGGWTSGQKEDMTASVAIAKQLFPDYAFVNIGYRLATTESPAFPKQIDDIRTAVSHIENGDYGISKNYAFLGVSAGAHLSMLYAYGFDPERNVKAICNIVGPTDFNDPAYTTNPLVLALLPYLSEDVTPEFLTTVSPISHVNAQAVPTIQFLGNADPLIPVSQGERLKAKLDANNVSNELHIYNAGHGDFNPADFEEIYAKLKTFFNTHL